MTGQPTPPAARVHHRWLASAAASVAPPGAGPPCGDVRLGGARRRSGASRAAQAEWRGLPRPGREGCIAAYNTRQLPPPATGAQRGTLRPSDLTSELMSAGGGGTGGGGEELLALAGCAARPVPNACESRDACSADSRQHCKRSKRRNALAHSPLKAVLHSLCQMQLRKLARCTASPARLCWPSLEKPDRTIRIFISIQRAITHGSRHTPARTSTRT